MGMAAKDKSKNGLFIVVEGLTCTGKSTFAKFLSESLNIEYISPVPDEFRTALEFLEGDKDALEARHCLFHSAMCYTAKLVNAKINQGQMVVVDSWIYRTQASHSAMGSTVLLKIPNWFPQPDLKILLNCAEDTRKDRLLSRGPVTGLWKAHCEDFSVEILQWYKENVKGWIEVDVARDMELVKGELLARVRPTIRRRREQLAVQTAVVTRKFLQTDLDALDKDIEHCQGLIREAKAMGQEATEQSSETWHDNYNFEEAQRQLKMHMNILGGLSSAREKSEVVQSPENPLFVDVGVTVYFEVCETGEVENVKIGSYRVSEENRLKGFISYEAPRVSGLMAGKVGEIKNIFSDLGETSVKIQKIVSIFSE